MVAGALMKLKLTSQLSTQNTKPKTDQKKSKQALMKLKLTSQASLSTQNQPNSGLSQNFWPNDLDAQIPVVYTEFYIQW